MAEQESVFGVAIVGCGTVGGAAAGILANDQDVLNSRLNRPPVLRYIVDVDFSYARELALDESLYCKDLQKALDDPQVKVVAELVGGTTIAKSIIVSALRAGKHVVTANKALLAHHGAELYALARECGVCIAFEGSCAGGIPIVRAICDGLSANRIDAIYGIVNGTCNYILTAMTGMGQSYAEALAAAQRDGLAEADPTLDVGGEDSAHKLAILSALAFSQNVNFDAIPVEGIDSLESCDVTYGEELGYVPKLLAIAQRQSGGLSLWVRPAFISLNHPLAWVAGPFNAVSVYGHATGHTMYYGRGAGGMPTASAVVADMVSVALGTAQLQFDKLKIWPDLCEPADQLPMDAVKSRYYVRILAADEPGVLGKIADVFGRCDISINSVLQPEQDESGNTAEALPAPVIITTHKAIEGNVRRALAEIDALDEIKATSVCIPIVDEYPEHQ